MSRAAPNASRAWRGAVGRAALYAFLARSLAYPGAAHRAALQQELVPVLRDARCGDDGLAAALGRALDAAAAPAEELLPAYRALFPAVGQGALAVYESVYRTRDVFQESAVLADVAGFYRAHGLAVGGAERERPDHIAVELEFMAFLARKRAHAIIELGATEVAACAFTERAFLRDHLGSWAPLVGAQLARIASHDAYASVGVLLEQWITRDRPADTHSPDAAPVPTREAGSVGPADDACPLEVLA